MGIGIEAAEGRSRGLWENGSIAVVISQFQNDINTIYPVVSFEDYLCRHFKGAAAGLSSPSRIPPSQLEAGKDYAQVRVNGRHMWITLT